MIASLNCWNQPLGLIADQGDFGQEPLDPLVPVVVVLVIRARSRYSARPPTRGQIDILLSLRMTSSFFFRPLALLNASKTMPEGKAPSPMTATEWRSVSPARSSPTFRPSAVDGRSRRGRS